jgi:hypothetical protein
MELNGSEKAVAAVTAFPDVDEDRLVDAVAC